MILDDGTGTGNTLKIDDKNRAYTYSVIETVEQSEAEEGLSFIVHKECHTFAATDGGLLHIKNNEQDYEMLITRIHIDSHIVTPSDLICVQVFDPTIVGGTDITSSSVINKNRGQAKVFDVSVTCSDALADMTYTGGTQYHSFPIKTMTQHFRDMGATNVIPSGKSVLFGFKRAAGGVATDGDVISFSVNIVKYKYR